MKILSFFKLYMWDMQDEYLKEYITRIHLKITCKVHILRIHITYFSKHYTFIHCKREQIPPRQNMPMVSFARAKNAAPHFAFLQSGGQYSKMENMLSGKTCLQQVLLSQKSHLKFCVPTISRAI